MNFNDKHPWKTSSPIVVTDEGISIFVNNEQPTKVWRAIDVIDEGI